MYENTVTIHKDPDFIKVLREHYPFLKIRPLDKQYRVFSLWRQWDHVIRVTKVDKKKLIPSYFDGDDFAVVFKSLMANLGMTGVGIVHDDTSVRVFNLLIIKTPEEKWEFKTFNPAKDTFVSPGSIKHKAFSGRVVV